MVDLSIGASRAYWQGFGDGQVFKVVALLESVETSLLEGDEAFEAAMEKLGETLAEVSGDAVNKPQAFVDVIAHLNEHLAQFEYGMIRKIVRRNHLGLNY